MPIFGRESGMKIAFVTDCHFGYRRFEQDAYQQGREAILAAAREADVLILGGDNFDVPLPRMETIADVTKILREAAGVFASRGFMSAPIFAIHGNHDRRARGFVHPTELLAQGGFLTLFHNKTVRYERNGEKIAISGMGSVPEDMARAGLEAIQCKPVEGAFNIFVVHQSFQEFERIPHEEYITFEDLPDGYDLYLCGHVHQPSLTGKVLNPGSTVITQLRADEVGQRGWLIYDTLAKKAEFRPVKSRQLFHKVLEFSDAKPEEVRAAVEKAAHEIVSQNISPAPVAKIVVKGTLAQGFSGSDLRLPQFGDNVYVENEMNSDSLRERIAQIKLSRDKKRSSREIGMELLREKLKGTSYSLGDPEKVFEMLLEGDLLKEIKERIEREKELPAS